MVNVMAVAMGSDDAGAPFRLLRAALCLSVSLRPGSCDCLSSCHLQYSFLNRMFCMLFFFLLTVSGLTLILSSLLCIACSSLCSLFAIFISLLALSCFFSSFLSLWEETERLHARLSEMRYFW